MQHVFAHLASYKGQWLAFPPSPGMRVAYIVQGL